MAKHNKHLAREARHLHCDMDIKQKGPHWGLYCKQHGKWIRWITHNEASILGINTNVLQSPQSISITNK